LGVLRRTRQLRARSLRCPRGRALRRRAELSATRAPPRLRQRGQAWPRCPSSAATGSPRAPSGRAPWPAWPAGGAAARRAVVRCKSSAASSLARPSASALAAANAATAQACDSEAAAVAAASPGRAAASRRSGLAPNKVGAAAAGCAKLSFLAAAASVSNSRTCAPAQRMGKKTQQPPQVLQRSEDN